MFKKYFSLRILIFLSLGFVGFWIFVSYIGASLATSPMRKEMLTIKEMLGLSVKEVDFKTEDGLNISAWFVDNRKQAISQQDTIVILMGGIWSDRRACMQNALFYLEKGYSVLLPDLRGTGKSEGDYVSYGWHERQDLISATGFLQKQGFQNIAVHGLSLGAATIAYSFQDKTDYAFVVLESCYDNIHNAFANRVIVFSLNHWICSLGKYFIESKIKIKAEQLSPESYISLYKGKLLILAGDSEYKVKIEETQKLFNLAKATSKKLYFFKKGKHESFIQKFPNEYAQVLGDFLHWK